MAEECGVSGTIAALYRFAVAAAAAGVTSPTVAVVRRDGMLEVYVSGELRLSVPAAGVGVPAFDPTQPCDMQRLRDGWKPGFGGVPTMCMRCKNPHHACDGGGVGGTDGR